MSLLLALMLAQSEDFPLQAGARWVYGRDGREIMILDAVETSAVGEARTITLRVRGRSFFWSTEDAFLALDAAGLRKHAGSLGEHILPKDPPLLLLPPSLEQGARWEGGDRFFEARVLGREHTTVPAGAFHAWKIEYTLRAHLGTEMDFRAWYAPGTGFVRLEYWQESTLGQKKALMTPERLDLLRFAPERKAAPVAPPPLPDKARAPAAAAIAQLADPDVDVRQKAAAELAALGRGVASLLLEKLGKTEDPELRGRLRDVLRRLPTLELEARLTRARGKVGEPLPVRMTLRNIGWEAVDIIPSLDDSDGLRYPRYILTVRDAQGVEQQPAEIPFCAHVNAVLRRDFVTLLPGEDFDPLGPGTFGHYMQSWRPSRPGVYTLEAVYDASGAFPDLWILDRTRRAEVLRRLEAMPRVRVSAKPLTIVVEP